MWCLHAPNKVSFFVWCVAKDKILTIDNLICHGKVIANRCCKRLRDGEGVTHLFTHYPVVRDLWAAVPLWWRMA